MNEALKDALRQLRLSGAGGTLDVRLQEARGNRLDYDEFLELLLRDELAVRGEHLVAAAAEGRPVPLGADARPVRLGLQPPPSTGGRSSSWPPASSSARPGTSCSWARPGRARPIWPRPSATRRSRPSSPCSNRSIFDLVRDFMREEDSGGVEKTLAKYLKPDLLIVDDMGLKQLPKRSGEYLFEIVMRRYELRSTAMTSNRPIEEWGKLIGDVPAAGAILDRFLHHAEIIAVNGRSYRLKDKAAAAPEGMRP